MPDTKSLDDCSPYCSETLFELKGIEQLSAGFFTVIALRISTREAESLFLADADTIQIQWWFTRWDLPLSISNLENYIHFYWTNLLPVSTFFFLLH